MKIFDWRTRSREIWSFIIKLIYILGHRRNSRDQQNHAMPSTHGNSNSRIFKSARSKTTCRHHIWGAFSENNNVKLSSITFIAFSAWKCRFWCHTRRSTAKATWELINNIIKNSFSSLRLRHIWIALLNSRFDFDSRVYLFSNQAKFDISARNSALLPKAQKTKKSFFLATKI